MKKGCILSTLLSSAILVSTAQGISAFASTPDIYCDIHYVNETFTKWRNTIYEGYSRVDVIFEGFDGISTMGIHVELGDGFEPVISNFTNKPIFNTNALGIESRMIDYDSDTNMIFLCMANGESMAYLEEGEEETYDGCYFSFYVQKTNEYTSSNATANVVFTDTDIVGRFDSNYPNNRYYYVDAENNIDVSEMLSSCEYIVGDVDGDGIVNSFDSSTILRAISQHNVASFYVSMINSNFRTWFPGAVCSASPDANEDYIINRSDADDIMEYFGKISSGGTGYLNIGSIEVYEIYWFIFKCNKINFRRCCYE